MDREEALCQLITSLDAAAMPAPALLELYHQRGTAEGLFGEVMDVLAPAPSSAARPKRHDRGRRLPSLPTETDAFARNEALFLLHLLAYEVLHIGRRLLETATKTGWSLRRMRERVLRVGGRVLVRARQATLVVAETAAPFWGLLWTRLDRLAWTGT